MTMVFNEKWTLNMLQKLVEIPSPTGYTQEIIKFIGEQLDDMGIPYTRTNKGSLIVTIRGQNHERQRLLTAHVDTLGAMVKEIKHDGRLKMSMVGGFNWNAVEGEYCTIHTEDGKKIRGTILMHQTSVHVYRNAGTLERTVEHMEVRIDEKVASEQDTLALGIQVGDFISFDPRFELTESGFVKSRHLDDKASTALLLHTLYTLKENEESIPHTTLFYISTNEEIGYGGNSSIPKEVVEYVAVDMGAIGDGQQSDEYTVSICAKDSSGPYHYVLTHHLSKLCREANIPYKLDIYPYYGSDASAAMKAGYDIKHALFGPGIESSHALERTHVESLKATSQLLYAYVTSDMVK